MMKKKGFTLIELLAVIVVLSIIALITMPVVFKAIESAKEGAALASANAYASQIEIYIALTELDPTKPKLQTGVAYQLSSSNYEVASLADPETTFINDLVDIKGDKPDSGYVIINEDKKIEEMEMNIDTYLIEYKTEKETCAIKGKQESSEEPGGDEEPDDKEPDDKDQNDGELTLTGNPVLDKAKTLVYVNNACKTDGSTYSYMGGCYLTGNPTNNYLWYNGFMWRIMGINHDGTVRLITDENVAHVAFANKNKALSYSTSVGYVNSWLNDYFYSHLNSTKDSLIAGASTPYFCSEVTTDASSSRTVCSDANKVTAKVGIISIDEYNLAGGANSYLNIAQRFWTMTPSKANEAYTVNIATGVNGVPTSTAVVNIVGVRPIINIDTSSSFGIITQGDGTTSNPFVLGETKTNTTGVLGQTVTSGDYVLLKNKTYRVVSKDSNSVKLILDGYSGKGPHNNVNFTVDSKIGNVLNTTVKSNLGLTDEDVIEATWYQSNGMYNWYSYTAGLEETNGVQARVGLIRVGEMLSGISSTMLTSKYTALYADTKKYDYWMMTYRLKSDGSIDTSYKYYASNYGTASQGQIAAEKYYRPVIVVSSTLPITTGTGLWNNPYQI